MIRSVPAPHPHQPKSYEDGQMHSFGHATGNWSFLLLRNVGRQSALLQQGYRCSPGGSGCVVFHDVKVRSTAEAVRSVCGYGFDLQSIGSVTIIELRTNPRSSQRDERSRSSSLCRPAIHKRSTAKDCDFRQPAQTLRHSRAYAIFKRVPCDLFHSSSQFLTGRSKA